MENTKLLERVKSLLIAKYPNFAEELAKVSIKYNSTLPCHTAATDGKNIYIDPDYLESLSDDDRVFLLAHEFMHIKFEHTTRLFEKNGERRDSYTWNIATDAIINANLERDGFKIKEGYVNIPEALNFNAEEMYQLLLQEQQDEQENQSSGQGSQNQSDSQGNDQGSNGNGARKESGQRFKGSYGNGEGSDHSMWGDSLENTDDNKENDQNSQIQTGNQASGQNSNNNEGSDSQNSNNETISQDGNNQQDNSGTKQAGKGNGNSAGRDVDHKQDDEYQIDEKQAFEKIRKERRDFARKKMEELKNQTLRDSQLGTEVGDLTTKAKPVVDWRLILRRAIERNEIIWSQRRSIAENNYAYRLEENDVEEAFTEVMIDTSGSISPALLTSFLRQLKPLLKNTQLKVGCFDDEFYGFTEIKKDEDIRHFRVRGGGGTDFEKAIQHFTFKPEVNKVVFTDGYDQMRLQDKKYAGIIWIVYQNKDFVPAVGKVIYVEKKDIMKQHLVKTNSDDEEFTL